MGERALIQTLKREAAAANRAANRARGSQVEDIAKESVLAGYGMGLQRAALLLSLDGDRRVMSDRSR